MAFFETALNVFLQTYGRLPSTGPNMHTGTRLLYLLPNVSVESKCDQGATTVPWATIAMRLAFVLAASVTSLGMPIGGDIMRLPYRAACGVPS